MDLKMDPEVMKEKMVQRLEESIKLVNSASSDSEIHEVLRKVIENLDLKHPLLQGFNELLSFLRQLVSGNDVAGRRGMIGILKENLPVLLVKLKSKTFG